MSRHRESDHHWHPRPGDDERIREHLARQHGLDPLLFVRLDDDRVVRVGLDAEGEQDDDH